MAFWNVGDHLGRLIGVRDEDLPDGWSGFVRYMERMIDERLEDSDVVHGVLEALARPAPPPIRLLPGGAWRAARVRPWSSPTTASS